MYALISTHVVLHPADNGEIVDATHYCSDWCAMEDPDYEGWYGCIELVHDQLSHGPWTCPGCGRTIELDEDELV